MDWQAAIDRHGAALRRIVSPLVAMFGADAGAALRAPDADPADRPTLARHRHRALMRLLRPAEAAARRLVIAVALAILAPPAGAGTGAAAAPPPADLRPRRAHRPGQPAAGQVLVAAGSGRTGIVIRHLSSANPTFGLAVGPLRPGETAAPALPAWAAAPAPKRPRALRLPLTDPVRRPKRRGSRCSRPSISAPGASFLPRVPARHPPGPHDRVDATRLVLRIEALVGALDDLPGEAKRFLRWRDRRLAERARDRRAEALAPAPDGPAPGETRAAYRRRMARRLRSLRPLRIGRPPGGRRRRNEELRGLRDELQWLACSALALHDTS